MLRTDRALRRDREPRRASLRVEAGEADGGAGSARPGLREALELAAANIRAVAEAQLDAEPARGRAAAGPDGDRARRSRSSPPASTRRAARAAYPSSVLMCCDPGARRGGRARGAGDPAGAGRPASTRSCSPRPSSAESTRSTRWAAPRRSSRLRLRHRDDRAGRRDRRTRQRLGAARPSGAVYGQVGIDSLAGPSELMVVAGRRHRPRVGGARPLRPGRARRRGAAGRGCGRGGRCWRRSRRRPSVPRPSGPASAEAPLALVQVPDLERRDRPRQRLRARAPRAASRRTRRCSRTVTTAGCVFAGRYGATAFGDYAAGSNHVLPTGGAGRFSGPLGRSVFRRKIATVEVPADGRGEACPARRRHRPGRGIPRPRRVGDD